MLTQFNKAIMGSHDHILHLCLDCVFNCAIQRQPTVQDHINWAAHPPTNLGWDSKVDMGQICYLTDKLLTTTNISK